MKSQFSQTVFTTCFTLSLFSISYSSVNAAPGNIGQIPLFVAPPTQPNIFFMMDDSGSMGWNLRRNGGGSIELTKYYINPTNSSTNRNNKRWRTWCLGSNALGYNSAIKYKPWSANMPGTATPYPDQIDITRVWSEPIYLGGIFSSANRVRNDGSGSHDLSEAPVVTWTDDDNDGIYDEGECPYSFSDTVRVKKLKDLPGPEQKNFANWFTYYRDRDRTVTAAVTKVISTSSARMGVGTLNGGAGVGIKVEDMTVLANKNALLEEVARIKPSGGTPLQASLNRVGEYFDEASTTPRALNISTASSDKPILSATEGGECQQNFAMLMTDGYGYGNAGVGHQDQDIDNTFVFPAHKDNRGNQLADVAMKWYKTDLSTLENKVPVQTGEDSQNLDENNKQHLVTFTIAFGLSDLLTDPVDKTETFNWPSGSLADMRHAAYNGRGKYLSAGNPVTLINSLQNVISDIESRQGSAAAVSFNSTSLMEDSSLFTVSFNTVGWTGNVRAIEVDATTGELGAAPLWNAASLLDSKTDIEMLDRTIYSWGIDSSGNKNGVLFDWTTENPLLEANTLADFKVNADASSESLPFTASQARLNFIRGDTSKDGVGLVRERGSRLGDIIHSAPHYVGAPVSNWPNNTSFGVAGDNYSSYQASLKNRNGVVYVGANDGLLHGFRTSDGEEVFAYLPSALASSQDNLGFHYLTEADYQHRYYVDGSPVSADVYMPIESGGESAWRTILVGALGGGGQGLYALDVTDPSQFNNTQDDAENTVLWEFTSQDDPDLGFSFSEPQIAKMNNGEWAVIIGNGYNAKGTDTAELLILFIEKGMDGTWSTGDYIKIDTASGTAVNKNGLSTPALLDLDNNGTTDRVYAGDLLGNLWAFDVSSINTDKWIIAHENAAHNSAPLFTATHHAGSPVAQVSTTTQPITMKPLLVKPDADWVADDSSNAPNVMVYFGTGQYIATGDATNTNQQTFYGIWDAGGIHVSPTQLVEQTFITGVPIDGRVLTSNTVSFPEPPDSPTAASLELGWFINLPETGERVVVDAFEYDGLIFFNTMTPSSEPCAAGGESWRMAVNMKTGGNPTVGAFDVNGDGQFDDLDKVSDGAESYFGASMKFNLGIASSTVVMKNKDGKAFGYTSGTVASSGGGKPSTNIQKDNFRGGFSVGKRRSWIQLFN